MHCPAWPLSFEGSIGSPTSSSDVSSLGRGCEISIVSARGLHVHLDSVATLATFIEVGILEVIGCLSETILVQQVLNQPRLARRSRGGVGGIYMVRVGHIEGINRSDFQVVGCRRLGCWRPCIIEDETRGRLRGQTG